MWYNVLIMSILHTKTLRNLSKLRKAQTLVQMQSMAVQHSCLVIPHDFHRVVQCVAMSGYTQYTMFFY